LRVIPLLCPRAETRPTTIELDPQANMEPDKALGLIALGWLIAAMLLMMGTIRRGRELAKKLAARHPEVYEAIGRPIPGYLESVRRRRFAQFVARREFENLGDPALAAQFEAYRRYEARLILSVLASLLVVLFVVVAVRYVV
jgi:hypothetical protein